MTAVCETLGVARSNITERVKLVPSKARGRPPLADHDLVEEIKAIISEMPTYGYCVGFMLQIPRHVAPCSEMMPPPQFRELVAP